MKDATPTPCAAACPRCPATSLSSLAALGLQVLSPLEQVHILGGSNLTVDQKAQQESNPVQQQINDFNCLEI